MSSPDASSSSPVTLDVGDRKFRTTRATLCYSDHFKARLDRWENDTDQQADGSLFVDVDPDVFQHILNFMRHPLMFPLFWTKKAGFNHALYMKIEAQADFFLLRDHAIKIHVEAKRLNHRNFDNVSTRTLICKFNRSSARTPASKSFEVHAPFIQVAMSRHV